MASLDLAARIRKCRGSLIDQLLVDDILPYLRQEGVLDQDGQEIIKHEITSTGQADKLIELILSKCLHDGGKAATSFTEALNHCQKHLCLLIRDTDVSSQDTERYLIEQFQQLDINAEPKEKEHNVFTETSEFLEKQLKETYSHDFCYLHPIPWNPDVKLAMKEMFSECTFIDITQQPNHQPSEGMSLGNQTSRPQEQTIDHLFDGTEACPEPRRITVEGPMGIGKTTMLHKLAYDWASNRNDQLTKRFKYVFYFPQHTLKGTLPQSIIETILPEDANSEHLRVKLMLLLNNQEIQQKTLILVDGFDENEDGLLNDIWIGKKLRYSTVVQTNQSGLHKGDLSKATEKHCLYLGLSPDGCKSFVEKYVSIMGISTELHNSLEDLPAFLKDLLNIPLFLSFICLLLEEKVSVSHMTQFHFLEEVVNLIEMRAASNLKISLEEVKKEMTLLGETAFRSILNPDVLQKPISNVLSHGFLIHIKNKSKLHPKVSTHFTHQLFQEYFAMTYLVSLAPEDMFREMKKLPMVHKMSMHVLMAGFMRTKKSLHFQFYKELISDMKEHNKYNQDQWDFNWAARSGHNPGHIVLQCLNESGVVEGIGPALSDVFPRCFQYNPTCKMCFKGLLLAADAYKLTSDVVINPMVFKESIGELERGAPCKGIHGIVLLTICGEHINKLLLSLIFAKFPDVQRLTISVNLLFSFEEYPIPGSDFTDEIAKRDLKIVALYLTTVPSTTVLLQPWIYDFCQRFHLYIMGILGCRLHVLGLYGLFIDSRMSRAITKCINNSPEIKSFTMSESVTSSQGINNILNALEVCHELRSFKMFGNRVTGTTLEEVSSGSEYLPAAAYQILQLHSLREVALGLYSISADKLMIQSKDLSSMSLDGITWTDRVPTHLLQILESSQLTNFQFRNFATKPELSSIFLDHITHVRNITRLNISSNQIGSSNVFQQICQHLASLSSLSELIMVRCGLTNETIHHMQGLMDQGNLTVLWIHSNNLSLKNILEIVEKLKLLKELSITVSQHEHETISKLYELLMTSGTFMRLLLCVVAENQLNIRVPMLTFIVEYCVVGSEQVPPDFDSGLNYKFVRDWMCQYQGPSNASLKHCKE